MPKNHSKWNGKKPIELGLYVQPWEQQPEEPPLWYDRFCLYRDLGRGRKVTQAWREYKAHKVGEEQRLAPVSERMTEDAILRSVRKMKPAVKTEWRPVQKYWRWDDRAAAWDRHLEAEKLRVQIGEVQEMGKRHAREAQAQIQMAMLPGIVLGKMMSTSKEEVMEQLEKEGVGKLMRDAVKAGHVLPMLMNAERQARGMATQITEQRLTGKDGGPIEVAVPVPIVVYLPDNKRPDVIDDKKSSDN